MLDGYPGQVTLANRFAFTNTDFYSELSDLGFSVSKGSHSNYTYTALTLASMLNLRYLDQLPEVAPLVQTPTRGRTQLLDAIDNATLFQILGRLGYVTYATSSGWEHVTFRGAVDHFLDHGRVTDFERNLFERTWVPELAGRLAGDWVINDQDLRIDDAVSDVEALAQNPESSHQFVYVHLPVPHLPLIFDAKGEPLSLGSMRDFGGITRKYRDDQYGPDYSAQLEVLNRKVLSLIRAIEGTERGRHAVIIVMSDHGYTHDGRSVIPRDRLANLLAVRVPGEEAAFTRAPTLVNLYRRIGQLYLGICSDELPDRYFVSIGQQTEQLLFAEVTNPNSSEPLQ
jgi:hypothetical protein